MKKKLLSMLFALTMLLTLLPTTAVAATIPDYTLYLSGGEVYQNSTNGSKVTDTGITFSNNTYTFTNVTFETSAATVVEIADADATINLVGTNTLTGGSVTGATYGLKAAGSLTITGEGSLTVTAGDSTSVGSSSGISATGLLTISGGTVNVTSGSVGENSSFGIFAQGGLTVTDGEVTGTAGSTTGTAAKYASTGIYVSSGKLTATSGATTGVGNKSGISIGSYVSLDFGEMSVYASNDNGTTTSQVTNWTNKDTTPNAKWVQITKAAAQPTYTVTYNANGGNAVSGSSLDTVSGVTALPSTLPTVEKSGYTFDGWYTDEDLTIVATAGATIAANTTLYAKWTVNSSTVSFNLNGHGNAISNQTITHGGKVIAPTEPTAEGYTFGGWYKESGCTNAWDFDTDTVAADTILYAKWTENSTPVTNYNLWINGEQVTSAASSGTDWSYDDSTKTLTLNNCTIEYNTGSGWNHAAILCGTTSSPADLTIDLVGASHVSCGESQGLGIYVTGTLTFIGNGSLNVSVTDDMSYNPITATTLNFGKADDASAFTGSVTATAPSESQAGNAISATTIHVYSGTVTAINEKSVYDGIGGTVNVHGGTVIAKGGNKAIAGTLNLGSGMVVKASTEFNGTLGAYESNKHNTYRYIKIDKGDSTSDTYLVTVNNGTGSAEYVEGATVTITANATSSGQRFKNWTSDDVIFADANASTTTFTMPARAVTVTANYETIPTPSTPGSGSSDPTYSIKDITAKSENGEIDLQKTYAHAGDKVTLTLKADAGYVLDTLVVTDAKGNEISVKANKDGTFTFEMPKGKVEVEATFKAENPFVDVAENAYYHDAVLWAVENGITEGATATSFAPGKVCTRAQIVTFLWRAAGCPAPVGTENPFTDLSSDAYYYDAVLWAVEKGITQGLTADTFGPQQTVTRGQSMTFLWRLDGAMAADGENAFSDVPAGAYFADAVQWAVEEEITNGMTASSFAPGSGCTRGQIVTFLYRYMA